MISSMVFTTFSARSQKPQIGHLRDDVERDFFKTFGILHQAKLAPNIFVARTLLDVPLHANRTEQRDGRSEYDVCGSARKGERRVGHQVCGT